MTACHLLEWDTAFFGKRIATVDGDYLTPQILAEIDGWCERQRVDCLYFLARADDSRTAELATQGGFRQVDVRIRLDKRLVRPVEFLESGKGRALPDDGVPERWGIRPALARDEDRLAAMARVSHTDSRFFFDPGFSRASCEALYERWIRESCHGYADIVLVAETDFDVGGYVTCHLEEGPEKARIGLLAVAGEARGNGLAQALLRHALTWFQGKGCDVVTVVTQARNVAAQRLYQRTGFLTASVGLWYHRWPGQ
jgi:ribosomal protein S18 acetylase RimI-like enzyme